MMTTVWSGLAVGAIYALVAVGFNIVYIVSGLFNFAQGSFVMVGGFCAYVLLVEQGVPYPLAIVLLVLVGALLGLLEERVAIRPLRGPNEAFGTLVTTIAVSVILTGVALAVWGSNPRSVPLFRSNAPLDLLGGRVLPVEIILVVFAVVVTFGLQLWTERSATGLACLAVAEDPDAAALRGVDVRRLTAAAFALASVLGVLTGALAAPKTFAVFGLGNVIALKGFLAIALGGFGSLSGALLGGMVVGLVESFGARWLGAEYANLVVFGLLIAVLMLRPDGAFGARASRAV